MIKPDKAAAIAEENSARLSPDELCEIAERMLKSTDPAEVQRLRAEFERGFYGDEKPNA